MDGLELGDRVGYGLKSEAQKSHSFLSLVHLYMLSLLWVRVWVRVDVDVRISFQ